MGLIDFIARIADKINIQDVLSNNNISLVNVTKVVNEPSNSKNKDLVKALYYDKEKDIHVLDLEQLPAKELQEVKRLISETPKNTTYIQEESFHLIEEAKNTLTDESSKSFIKRLDGFIPPEDIEILKSAMVIKRLHGLGETKKIPKIKQALALKYGKKANVITNLYTANYFEGLIVPLLESMQEDIPFNIDRFIGVYQGLIEEFPFAIFVSSEQTEEQVFKEIKAKIKKNKYYGIKNVSIHGIGGHNITTIVNATMLIENEFDDIEKTVNQEKGVIRVKLLFKANSKEELADT